MTQRERPINLKEVAAHYGVGVSTARRWVAKRILVPAFRTPSGGLRFLRSTLPRDTVKA